MKNIRKVFVTICVGMVILCFASATCQAATASWKLRYVKGGPASLQIEEWSEIVTTTKTTTKMSVSNITDGATVFVYTSNGIGSVFSTEGSTSIKAEKNVKIYARARYGKYGDRTNYPKGTLSY